MNIKMFQKEDALQTPPPTPHILHTRLKFTMSPNIFCSIVTSFISFSNEYWLQAPKQISRPAKRWQLQSEATILIVLTEMQAPVLYQAVR